MVAALSFLLGYENIEEEDESDASSSEDESIEKPIVLLSKEDVYKVSPSLPH
jgi:protein SDA1